MTDNSAKPRSKKPGRPKKIQPNPSKYTNKEVLERIEQAVQNYDNLPYVKPKGPLQLKGQIISGSIFIGDASFFGDDSQKYADGIIPDDTANPFKDWNKFSSLHEDDSVLDLPFFGPPGRGIVIQTHMQSGTYSVDKEVDEQGKLLSVKVTFHG